MLLLGGVPWRSKTPLMERLSGTGDESHLPQPRGIGESPPRTEEGEEDHSAGRAPRWEDQWLDFLERVKSRGMLEEEEEALWDEAKVLLASLEPEPEDCGRPGYEWAEQHVEVTLAVLPLELRSWLRARGLQTCAQVVALAEAFSWRQLESWRRECQVAAGHSSSAVRKNPPGLGQEGGAEWSLSVSLLLPAGLMPDSKNEADQPGMLLEREDEETLQDWERIRGPEEMMEELIPWSQEAFEAQEQETEDRSPGPQSSSNVEEGLNNPLLPEEGVVQINTPGCGALGTAEKLFLCLECGKSFARRHHLTVHRRIHTGEKPYQCSECGKSFTQSNHLTLHQRIHTGEKPYKCPDCSNSFANASTFRKHRRLHTGEKPYQCSDCGKSFTQSRSLTLHQRIHSGETPHKRPDCSNSSAHASTFRKHRRIHTGGKPYQCSECGKNFRYAKNLSDHQRIHTGERTYQCYECGMCFRGKETLVAHQHIHTVEKPYKCSECGKSFRRKDTLLDHQRIHTGEKPYPCSLCGSSFRHLQTLSDHQSVHASEKPYKCLKCEKSFARRRNLKLHQKIHTGPGETLQSPLR